MNGYQKHISYMEAMKRQLDEYGDQMSRRKVE